MISRAGRLILGVVLIAAAVLLAREPAYTSVKRAVADAGAPIEWAVAAAWGLIVLALASGITLLRRA